MRSTVRSIGHVLGREVERARLEELLADRPLGADASVGALETLTMRMVGYLEAA